jgi:hypothetical protein
MAISAFPGNRCIMSFSTCPETFNRQTILVPDDVIGIAPSIPACNDSMQNAASAGPSILFVIDNSPSMVITNDVTGARFNVTRDLIDSIAVKWPQAEVGLVIFQARLEFDTSTSQKFYYAKYFNTMSTVYKVNPMSVFPSQAYLKFLRLNGNYDGKTGQSILRDVLKTRTDDKALLDYPTPQWNRAGGTNINLAFLAAREAFAYTKSSKDQQYIVFLSDGEPTTPLSGYDLYYFRDSTQGLPMTSTVFFPAWATPPSLQIMTDNVKKNNYSAINPQSNITSIDASYGNLMTVLMKNVISKIIIPPLPYKVKINMDSSTIYFNGNYIFADTFKLDKGINAFIMEFVYRIFDPFTGQSRDSLKQIDFSVHRSSSATTAPAGISLACVEDDSLRIVAGAAYFDENADGVVDRIVLSFAKPLRRPESVTVSAAWRAGNVSVGNIDALQAGYVNADSTRVYFPVIGGLLQTGGLMDINLQYQDFPGTLISTPAVDSAAPVVAAAVFTPGKIQGDRSRSSDTLRVTFSENVSDIASQLPFMFYSSVVGEYRMALSQNSRDANRVTFAVDSLDSRIQYPRNGDSIRINTAGRISDANGFAQLNPANRRVAMKIEPLPYQLVLRMGPNPFDPDNAVAYTVNGRWYTGLTFEIDPMTALDDDGLGTGLVLSGAIIIYDAVGNLVAMCSDLAVRRRNIRMEKDPLSSNLYFSWNGCNMNNRVVGSGSYLAVITISDNYGNRKAFRRIVGVVRNGQ